MTDEAKKPIPFGGSKLAPATPTPTLQPEPDVVIGAHANPTGAPLTKDVAEDGSSIPEVPADGLVHANPVPGSTAITPNLDPEGGTAGPEPGALSPEQAAAKNADAEALARASDTLKPPTPNELPDKITDNETPGLGDKDDILRDTGGTADGNLILDPVREDVVHPEIPASEMAGGAPAAESSAQFENVTQQAPTPTFEEGAKFYTTLPIKEIAFGRFRFKDGQMKLTDLDEIVQFDRLLSQLPMTQRNKVRTIDLVKANALAAGRAPVATRGFDSGQNPAGEQMKKQFPKIGTTNMGRKESGQGN